MSRAMRRWLRSWMRGRRCRSRGRMAVRRFFEPQTQLNSRLDSQLRVRLIRSVVHLVPLLRCFRRGRRFRKELRFSQPYCSSAPAEGATSSVELQPSAGDGVGLRGSKSRRSSANSSAQPTAPVQAPCLAQHGAKTVVGFRARRTSTTQSSSQFSAPFPPHCGSACAPPRFCAPARFIYIRLTAEIVESLL